MHDELNISPFDRAIVGCKKPRLKLVTNEKPGPSLSFLRIGRNPSLRSPVRFEPTTKREGDVIL